MLKPIILAYATFKSWTEEVFHQFSFSGYMSASVWYVSGVMSGHPA